MVIIEETGTECSPLHGTPVPVRFRYNSLIHETLPAARVGAPPLIAAPVHEWNTMLTVLKQAQAVSARVKDPGKKTVISLDVGLYEPANKLQMARSNPYHIVFRPGELHVLMAQVGKHLVGSLTIAAWTFAGSSLIYMGLQL